MASKRRKSVLKKLVFTELGFDFLGLAKFGFLNLIKSDFLDLANFRTVNRFSILLLSPTLPPPPLVLLSTS